MREDLYLTQCSIRSNHERDAEIAYIPAHRIFGSFKKKSFTEVEVGISHRYVPLTSMIFHIEFVTI
jgi:hypothetical protein